jgi:NADPH:quinone reductase
VFEQSIPVTSHFGRLVTILEPGPLNWSEARMRNLLIGFELMLTPMLRDLHEARDKHVTILQQCAEWFDQESLKIHLSDQIPLAEAAEAHKKIEEGHTQGKIVLTV